MGDSKMTSNDKLSKKDKKKHSSKKEKRREKDLNDGLKEKSLLGLKLQQRRANLFGTSSEDEGTTRNSKPPTPNTNASKQSSLTTLPAKGIRLNIDQVYSDSDPEKQIESPALESDSDDGLPSRPPTPSFPSSKTEETKISSNTKV